MLKLPGRYSCQSKHGSNKDSNKSVWRQSKEGLIRQIAHSRFCVLIYDTKKVEVRDLFCFESKSVFIFCSRFMTVDWLYQFTLFHSFFLMGMPETLIASFVDGSPKRLAVTPILRPLNGTRSVVLSNIKSLLCYCFCIDFQFELVGWRCSSVM